MYSDDHGHHHHTDSESRLVFSILLNLLITLAEVVGGVFSGSLALLSDALHNFNDSASLLVSLVTLRISRRTPDRKRTFGYQRAAILGALFNLASLVLVAFFLIKEAVERYLNPQPVNGLVMFVVAIVGLLANLATAWLLHDRAHTSLNVRSSFVHIISDALSSVGVILAGAIIIVYDFYLVDTFLTVLISLYILYQSYKMMRQTLRILMQSVPEGLEYERIVEDMRSIEGVQDIHHLHVWQLDESHTNLEAHIVIDEADLAEMGDIKRTVKRHLREIFGISHATLEFELLPCEGEPESCYEQHPVRRSDR